MLPVYPWRRDHVLLLLLGALAWGACVLVGAAVALLLPAEGWDWLRVFVATVSFQGGALVVLHVVVMRTLRLEWRQVFGFDTGRLVRVLGLGALVGVMVLPLAWLASRLMAEVMRLIFLEPATQDVVVTFQETRVWWAYGLIGVMAVVVVPAAEEVLFRGLLYPFFKRRMSLELAVAMPALLFGLIHGNMVSLPSLVFLGLVLTWLYELTGNLLAPIVAHAVFNLANILLLLTV